MADVTLKDVRLAFPDLWKAVEFKPGDGKARYNATFLVVPGSANDKAIEAAIKAAAEEAYGAKADKFLAGVRGNTNKFAYLDGDLKEYAGYEGMMYLACHSKVRPLVIDRRRNPLTEADGQPYAGCYVTAKVSLYALKGDFPGVFASFSGVQFVRDGDAFSGGSKVAPDDFDDLGDTPDEDLT